MNHTGNSNHAGMSPAESLVTETIVSPETVFSVDCTSLLVGNDSLLCSTGWIGFIKESAVTPSLLVRGKQSSWVSLKNNEKSIFTCVTIQNLHMASVTTSFSVINTETFVNKFQLVFYHLILRLMLCKHSIL